MQIMLPCLPFRCRAVSKEALGIMQRAGSFKVTLLDTPMFHCATPPCLTALHPHVSLRYMGMFDRLPFWEIMRRL